MQEAMEWDAVLRWLQVDQKQLEQLVTRGQIPARIVDGTWRFSPGEIMRWLEETIGSKGTADLPRLQQWLRENQDATSAEVAGWLRPETIRCPLRADTAALVIEEMVQLVGRTGLLRDQVSMRDAVRERETLHPTALDNGVALLHPRRPMSDILEGPVLAIGGTREGVPFGGPRGKLTDIFFLICSVDDAGHLQMLARISRMLADPEFLLGLRTSMEPDVLHYWICQYEQQMDADST